MSPARPSDPRRDIGARGETVAVAHLKRAGYEILDRNWRCREGELDIVAVDSHALVFCEVKTRVWGGLGGPSAPLEGIGAVKRRRLRSLARVWMAASERDRPHPPEVRFDAIGVTIDRAGALLALEHVEDAF